jgi:rhomboid protease GlpG
MRLVGNLPSERQAGIFCRFLSANGIPASFEPYYDALKKKKVYHIWVENEDDHARAYELFERFNENPAEIEAGITMDFQPKIIKLKPPGVLNYHTHPTQLPRPVMTFFFVIICCFLFLLNGAFLYKVIKKEGKVAGELGMTPILKEMLFDYPYAFEVMNHLLEEHPLSSLDEINKLPPAEQMLFKKAEKIPYWKGLYALATSEEARSELKETPLFEKIGQGQIWRLVSPILLHGNLIHILFNMIWLWILGKQMEQRMHRVKLLIFIIIAAIVSNVAQYLASGPFFLGFSGVLAAMIGYIYIRQKIAPWEGYPLERIIIIFLFYFIILMVVLQIIAFILDVGFHIQFPLVIANTAHIVGGLLGMLLARVRYFAGEAP